MKNNKILILGIAGMGFLCLLQLILIFTKAPNPAPRSLIVGYSLMALLTLAGVIKGMLKK